MNKTNEKLPSLHQQVLGFFKPDIWRVVQRYGDDKWQDDHYQMCGTPEAWTELPECPSLYEQEVRYERKQPNNDAYVDTIPIASLRKQGGLCEAFADNDQVVEMKLTLADGTLELYTKRLK